MRMASASYPRYRWVAALIFVVVVLGSAALTRSFPLTTVELKSVHDAQATLSAGSPSSLSSNQASTNLWSPAAGLLSLPVEVRSSISAVLGRDLPGYQARVHGRGFAAQSERHRLTTDFTSAGVEMRSGNAVWKLALRSYGYGDGKPVTTAIPLGRSNRVEYHHEILTEWYVNGPLGLEQGFTLRERPMRQIRHRIHSSGFGNVAIDHQQSTPANSFDQPLTIALAASGNVRAVVDKDRTGLTLINREGQAVLQYTGFAARDATEKQLRAWLEVKGEQLLLKVQDATARYPVVIDPWVQVAKLTASDATADNFFGLSVAIAGNTVVVGLLGASVGGNSMQGAAYVFVEPATGWADVTQTAKLMASDGKANDLFGDSVGISGNTVVGGALGASVGGNSSQGAAYVFVEPTTGWADMTQTAKLTASDGKTADVFGSSVAISGNTVVAGAPQITNGGSGAAYVFVEPATGWVDMTQTAKLTASDAAPSDELGAVALNGNTVIAGAPCKPFAGDVCGPGAAYVFVQPAGGWSDMTETAKLIASDGTPQAAFGESVAISGNTVVAGAGTSNNRQGAAYVFVEPTTGWADTTQTAKLTASDGKADDVFGESVAISGNTVVAGAEDATIGGNSFEGAAYVFVEPAIGWVDVTQTAKLTASDGMPRDFFGRAVTISGDTVVAGSATNHATYVFGSTQIPFSHFSGGLTIDPDAGILYLAGGFTLGPGGSIDPSRESVTFSVGSYSVTLLPGSFVRSPTGYVYQKSLHDIFLRVFIKFTSRPGTYQLLANRIGGTLSTTTSPVPVTLTIGDNSSSTRMNAKFY